MKKLPDENKDNGFDLQMVNERVKALLDSGQPVVYISIEGGSASGKTTLGGCLAKAYGAELYHMDDFFLRPGQRTPERLLETGGNVDYERFQSEVWTGILSGKPFSYQVYDCRRQSLGRFLNAEPGRIHIIEGAYSRHPYFREPYHLKIFCRVSKEEQRERIRRRNGERMLKRFLEEWIPKEDAYFKRFSIMETSDIVL